MTILKIGEYSVNLDFPIFTHHLEKITPPAQLLRRPAPI